MKLYDKFNKLCSVKWSLVRLPDGYDNMAWSTRISINGIDVLLADGKATEWDVERSAQRWLDGAHDPTQYAGTPFAYLAQ